MKRTPSFNLPTNMTITPHPNLANSCDAMKIPELLAPAGNFEKLEVAIDYGADAVYLAGKAYSLRNFSGNFSEEELAPAVQFARKRGVKTYLACNIFSRNKDLGAITQFLEKTGRIAPDALIIADPGILHIAKKSSRTFPSI